MPVQSPVAANLEGGRPCLIPFATLAVASRLMGNSVQAATGLRVTWCPRASSFATRRLVARAGSRRWK